MTIITALVVLALPGGQIRADNCGLGVQIDDFDGTRLRQIATGKDMFDHRCNFGIGVGLHFPASEIDLEQQKAALGAEVFAQ